MQKEIVFIVREYNHLDQITPIIDTLITSYKITILLSDREYDYERDMNLQYLKNKYTTLKIVHLYTLYFQETIFLKYIYTLYSQLVSKRDWETHSLKKQIFRVPAYLLNKILNNFIDKYIINFKTILLSLEIDTKNCLIVTDFGGDKLYEQILKQVKDLKIITIGIVHGLNVHTNKILITNQLSFPKEEPNKKNFNYLDYLSYMITYCKEGYNHISSQIQEEKKSFLLKLPTLRYTKYWVNKKLENEAKFTTNMDYKLKIVYMVTSENYNMWTEEEFRTLKMLSMVDGINIVIKPHPRTLGTVAKMRSLESENFKIVDNSISSSSLIIWSDIVMISSSSILIECVTQRKPIIYMKYLHCNSINIEKYKSLIYEVNTRDDLLNTVQLFLKDRNYSKIDNKEYNTYLYDYILNNDYVENSAKYSTLFKNIFKKLDNNNASC